MGHLSAPWPVTPRRLLLSAKDSPESILDVKMHGNSPFVHRQKPAGSELGGSMLKYNCAPNTSAHSRLKPEGLNIT